MNRKTILIIVLGMLILSTACVQQDLDPLAPSANTPASDPGGDGIEIQQEGIGPLEITPQPGGGIRATAPSGGQFDGIISSSGNQSSSGLVSGDPGQFESVAPSDLTREQEESLSENWLTYQDLTFSFSINYPDTYTILSETAKSLDSDPAPIHQVRFLDIQLARGDTAEFEIPNFTIAVFELGNQSLEAFVANDENGAHRELYTVKNMAGFRVYYNQLIAPNEYYYFSNNGYAYKLTPLGSYSQEMLDSFQIQ